MKGMVFPSLISEMILVIISSRSHVFCASNWCSVVIMFCFTVDKLRYYSNHLYKPKNFLIDAWWISQEYNAEETWQAISVIEQLFDLLNILQSFNMWNLLNQAYQLLRRLLSSMDYMFLLAVKMFNLRT